MISFLGIISLFILQPFIVNETKSHHVVRSLRWAHTARAKSTSLAIDTHIVNTDGKHIVQIPRLGYKKIAREI